MVLGFVICTLLGAVSLAHTTNAASSFPDPSTRTNKCVVHNPGPNNDSAPYITKAFQECGRNGVIAFENSTYSVQTVLQTRNLYNVEVQFNGTLVWSTDLSYWLNHSLPVGFQNQSTAWVFSGEQIQWNGYGHGTFNGNGQAWYAAYGRHDNYPGRPHAITFYGLNNSMVEGMRFIQSQMWTMSILYSNHNTFQDIYVNSTWLGGGEGEKERLNQNTDGADTVYSANVTFSRWTVDNGDDAISAKSNSTNILVQDCTFYRGLGIAIGSIGQTLGEYEQIVNFHVKNLTTHNAPWAAYIKTWGYKAGNKPLGQVGGATGRVQNITLEDIVIDNASQLLQIGECYGYYDDDAACNAGRINVSDVSISRASGTLTSAVVVDLLCSDDAPCDDIRLEDVSVKTNGSAAEYLCRHVASTEGFSCNGLAPHP